MDNNQYSDEELDDNNSEYEDNEDDLEESKDGKVAGESKKSRFTVQTCLNQTYRVIHIDYSYFNRLI